MFECEGPAVGEVGLTHFLPEVGEAPAEKVVIGKGAAQEILERPFVRIISQQARVFRKHTEQDAHQEQAGFFQRCRVLPIGGA